LTRWSRTLPYLLIFLGFALRLCRIAYQSVWWDEAHAVQVARGGLAAVLNTPAGVAWTHPPLHYGLLAGWTHLAGFSELSIRYLSLIGSVLLLPVAYLVVRRLFDRPTALVSMAVVALSPLYVIYAQEARVYAILPLLYLLLLHTLHRLTEMDPPVSLRPWLALSLVEVLILYAHFIVALGIIYANLTVMVDWLRRRRFPLRAWVGSQVLAAAPFVPWLWNMAHHLDNIRPWMSVGETETGPGLLDFVSRILRFTIGGNEAAAGGCPLLAMGTALLVITGVLTLPLAYLNDSKRHQVSIMLAHGLVPLSLCFVLWQVWPLSHPRYTIAFSIPFFIVASRSLVVLWNGRGWRRLICGLFAGALALAFGLGLYVQYFDERFHKDDVRSVAAYLEETATAGDVVLIGPDDYSIPYYYGGPAFVAMARDEPRADKVRHLAEITAGRERLFLVHWDPSKADLHGLRPFLLERAGRLVAWHDFRGLDVRTYALNTPTSSLPELVKLSDPQARFGPLLVTGAWYEPAVATDNAVAVTLGWELIEQVADPYKVVVILTDAEGRRLSSADVLLLDDAGRQTHHWTRGTGTTNFYVVPVPVGTPPLPHRLLVGVYDADTLARLPLVDAGGQPAGQDLVLGEVTLVPGQHADSDPYGTWNGVDWETPGEAVVAEGLRLEQFAVWPRAALPGGQVTVLARWRAEGASRRPAAPLLRLSQNGQVWAEIDSRLLADLYPSDRWAAGEVVVEQRQLTYPPRRGIADLVLVTGHRTVSLGHMELDESALSWEAPSSAQDVGVRVGDFAELLGYELGSAELAAGQPFRLALYWRALNDAPLETPYTVFTQLLAADGHLIAQHDGPPVENERPTTTWVGGEVIADVHVLTFSDPTYTGTARLIVGLYDSATVTRVGTAQGQDHVALLEVTVVNHQ
jgi:4-amino-4-deoxy-L-arabinose transferase-like glycosyltransferase